MNDPVPSFGNPQLEVTGRGRQGPATVSVALVGAGVGALVDGGADRLGELGLDQSLIDPRHDP
jgi:hypothetical protein